MVIINEALIEFTFILVIATTAPIVAVIAREIIAIVRVFNVKALPVLSYIVAKNLVFLYFIIVLICILFGIINIFFIMFLIYITFGDFVLTIALVTVLYFDSNIRLRSPGNSLYLTGMYAF